VVGGVVLAVGVFVGGRVRQDLADEGARDLGRGRATRQRGRRADPRAERVVGLHVPARVALAAAERGGALGGAHALAVLVLHTAHALAAGGVRGAALTRQGEVGEGVHVGV